MYKVTNNTSGTIRAAWLTLESGQTLLLPQLPPDIDGMIAKNYLSVSKIADIASDAVMDNTGVLFSPGSCSHVYTYDGNGKITTDVATLAGITRIKTFTWTANKLTGESLWVKQ